MPIEDMKVQARLWFSSCAIQACKRDANRAAHAVARLGYSCDVNCALLWEDDVPAVAANVVVGEMPSRYVFLFLPESSRRDTETHAPVIYSLRS